MRSHHNFIAATLSLIVSIGLGLSTGSAEEKIVLDGSSGMLPLARALVKAYQDKHPDPQVELGKGVLEPGERLQALAEGTIQIALDSRGIKPEDAQKGNLKVIEVAKGTTVFGVNASVPLSNITEQQICDIYNGNIRNWQPIAGSDSSIAVLTRRPTDVDPEVIRAKVGCFKDLKVVENVKVMARGGEMAKELAETLYSIGMTSMTVVEQSGGKIKALNLNGIEPTPENVRNGRYFLTRDFLFVIKAEPTPGIRKFLQFVQGPDGHNVIVANGAIPLR